MILSPALLFNSRGSTLEITTEPSYLEMVHIAVVSSHIFSLNIHFQLISPG